MVTIKHIVRPWTKALATSLGLIAVVISIWLLPVPQSIHAGNMTVSSRPLPSTSQVETSNTIPSNLLDGIFQKCFTSSLNPSIRSALNSADVAAIKKDAIQNMTATFQRITNESAFDQRINETNAKAIKPIASDIANCMEQKLELKQTQQNQQPQPYPFPLTRPPPSTNFTLQLPPPSTNYPPPTILSHSTYFDSIGTLHIVGEVVNQSPVNAKFVKIIATLYNAYNQVIGTQFTYTQPSEVAPGQRAPFDIFISSGGVPMNQVRTYTLTVSTS